MIKPMESELISTPSYPTRLKGIVLHLARLAWLVVTLASLGLFVSGLPARYNVIRTIYQGNIQVGLLRNPQGEYIFVTGSGSAAARAGVLDRDILLSIDGVSIAGLALEQIQGMLAGAVGSTVQLSVRTGGFPPRQVTVTRDSEQGRILQQFGLSTDFAALFVLASEIVFAGLCRAGSRGNLSIPVRGLDGAAGIPDSHHDPGGVIAAGGQSMEKPGVYIPGSLVCPGFRINAVVFLPVSQLDGSFRG